MKQIITLATLLLGIVVSAQNQYKGKVGINIDTPEATLHIQSKTGTTSATKNIELENSSATKIATVLDNGNVGINQEAPTTKLHINNGTTNGAIKIVDGTQKANKVLTTDDDGVGTWQSATYWENVPINVTEDTPIENIPLTQTTKTIPKAGYYMVIYHAYLKYTSATKESHFKINYYLNGEPISNDGNIVSEYITYYAVQNEYAVLHIPTIIRFDTEGGTFGLKLEKVGSDQFLIPTKDEKNTSIPADVIQNSYDLVYMGAL